MGQPIMIAMMLIAGPEILIADEPASALDVSVQQHVLAITDEMVKSRGIGLILISHNLHLVASFCDRVLVMYAGQIERSAIPAGCTKPDILIPGVCSMLSPTWPPPRRTAAMQRDRASLVDLSAAVGAAAWRRREPHHQLSAPLDSKRPAPLGR
jgi:peptide/nickel transport system ATP-binding protein